MDGVQVGPSHGSPDLGVAGCERAIEIGRGGFGVVYRAWQAEFERTVAVKILNVASVEGATRRRFARELRAMGKVSGHPHIVTVYHAGFTPAGNPYLVMGFEPGGSLADRLRTLGPLTWRDAVAVGVKMSGALETAHRADVLHRDLKPENILLSAFGHPKLADFGLALVQGGAATHATALVATIPHAAPELLGGAHPSVASDVYALASTVYTLIRGRPAFVVDDATGPLPMMMRIVDQPVPDLRSEGVPDAVCCVLEQAMAKSPAARPSSAEAFGRELLRAHREGCPSQTEPLSLVIENASEQATDGAAELVGRPVRRRPAGHDPPSSEEAPPGPESNGHTMQETAVLEVMMQETALLDVPVPDVLRSGPSRRRPSRHRLRFAAPVSGIAAVILIAALVFPGHLHSPWTTGAPMPIAREWLTAATGSNGRIYAIGGWNGQVLHSVEAYDPPTDSWADAAPVPTARWGAAAATGEDGRIFAIGGFTDRPVDTMEVFTPSADTWASATRMPTARRALAAVAAADGRIYALGGLGSDHALDTVEVYTPGSDSWATAAPLPTPRGVLAATAGPDGRIYAIGGTTGGTPDRDLRTVEVYTPSTNSWAAAAPLPAPRSGLAAVTGSDGRIYAIGGFTDHPLDTVDVYTPSTDTWTPAAPMPTARFAAAARGTDGRIYVIGGGLDTRNLNTVEAFTPDQGSDPGRAARPEGDRPGLGWRPAPAVLRADANL
ncbi:MAG: protein kinase [Chloroflexi bacterium]|jgi:serine/threonine protein kinase|nr:protein kinase [Chloroflexota bacterium]